MCRQEWWKKFAVGIFLHTHTNTHIEQRWYSYNQYNNNNNNKIILKLQKGMMHRNVLMIFTSKRKRSLFLFHSSLDSQVLTKLC